MKAITLNAEGKITSGINFAIDTNNRVDVGSRWVLCHDNLINIPVNFFNEVSNKIDEILNNNKFPTELYTESVKYIKNLNIPEQRFFRASLMAKHKYRAVNILVPEQDEQDNRLLVHFVAGAQRGVTVTSLCHKYALLEESEFIDFDRKSNTDEKIFRLDSNGRFLFKVESNTEKTKYFILTWDGIIAKLKQIKEFSSYDRFTMGKLNYEVNFNVESEELNAIYEETDLLNKLNDMLKKSQLGTLQATMA